MQSSTKFRTVSLHAVLVVLAVPGGASAQPRYSMVDLGTLGGSAYPYAISANGLVAGNASTPGSSLGHAFLYTPGRGMQDLHDRVGFGNTSTAFGVNSRGQVAGAAVFVGDGIFQGAFLFTPPDNTRFLVAPALAGGVALGINEAGQVTGQSGHAFVYTPGGSVVDIDTVGSNVSAGLSINNAGQVTGYSYDSNGHSRAFLYTPGSGMTLLGRTFGGPNSSGQAINDAGWITGTADVTGDVPATSRVNHAFLYNSSTITIADLGVLPGARNSSGLGINNSGQIVGSSDQRAFLYSAAGMVDLNSLLVTPSPWTLTAATAINDGGQIVAAGVLNGQTHAFLLNPVSFPIYSGASRFVPATPCRAVDTRGPAGPLGGPAMAAGATRQFVLPASCGLSSAATAYAVNLTVVPRGSLSYVTLWPAGQQQPLASTLNSFDGRVKANAAVVPAGFMGAVNVFATGDTDVVLDVNGYFVRADGPEGLLSGLSFYPLPVCRAADTRNGGSALNAGETRNVGIRSSPCNVPASARAYSLNITAVPSGPLWYLTAWPAGAAQPLVSTLNAPTGTVVANSAFLPAGENGDISLYATGKTDVVIDINGYFAPPGSDGGAAFHAVAPCRAVDTRDPAGPLGGPGLAAGESRFLALWQAPCGLPSQASAYLLNATAVPSGVLAYLTLWQAGLPLPLASTLNSFDGAVTSNAAVVPAGTNAAINAFAAQPTHLVLDVSGYFAP